MLTFLEYVCERLMGPPAHNRTWLCPFHDDSSPSFHVRPPKQRPDGSWYPIKFRCFGCDAWGDEFDLLRQFYPDATRQQLTKRWQAMKHKYEALTGLKAPNSYRGQRGHDVEAVQFCLAELRSVIRERGMKWRREDAGLRVLVWASSIAEQNGITLDEFARHCASELIQAGAAKC